MLVVDASVYAPLIATCGRALLDTVKQLRFVVLDLTIYEVCNVFWKEHRKLNRIGREEAVQACRAAKSLTRYMRVYSIGDLCVGDVMKIAIENNITFYDASYIALARVLQARLASEDKDILNVAPSYGVEVVRLRELLNRFTGSR